MPTRVHLVHKVFEGRFDVYPSPEVKGLHASADTMAEAQRESIKMLDFISTRLVAAGHRLRRRRADGDHVFNRVRRCHDRAS